MFRMQLEEVDTKKHQVLIKFWDVPGKNSKLG